MKVVTLNSKDDSISIVTTESCNLSVLVDYMSNRGSGGITNIKKVDITSATTTRLLEGFFGIGMDVNSINVYNKGEGKASFRLLRGDFPISNVIEVEAGCVVKVGDKTESSSSAAPGAINVTVKSSVDADSIWNEVENEGVDKRAVLSVEVEGLNIPVVSVITYDADGEDGYTLSETFDIHVGANAGMNTSYGKSSFGFAAAANATGLNGLHIGRMSGALNSGNNVVSLGDNSCGGNSGESVVASGNMSGLQNSGSKCIFYGSNCGKDNTADNILAIGHWSCMNKNEFTGTIIGHGINPTKDNQFLLGVGYDSDNSNVVLEYDGSTEDNEQWSFKGKSICLDGKQILTVQQAAISGSDDTLENLAAKVNAIISALSAHGLIAANGQED